MTSGENTKICTGCDVVDILRFKKSLKRAPLMEEKMFLLEELKNMPPLETLAGMFAAKEAVIKALGLGAGAWKKIEILKNSDGKPSVKIAGFDKEIISCDISISHDGGYAMAMAVFLLNF